ncbi:hypothetical protein GDO81_024088 [Engystomops pustulosus]|uniref:Uncharacterized protein n=1 Tax=Engystomops pustulosus TaxID=76066 RepID=A0AAV6Z3U4_ENGPU|nr:hypothetical protein GDO81_024088 [Engystomops pustulosus]
MLGFCFEGYFQIVEEICNYLFIRNRRCVGKVSDNWLICFCSGVVLKYPFTFSEPGFLLAHVVDMNLSVKHVEVNVVGMDNTKVAGGLKISVET